MSKNISDEVDKNINWFKENNEVIEDGIWAQKEFAQDMFEGLSEEEIKVFMNVFQKVYDNAERMISNEKNS